MSKRWEAIRGNAGFFVTMAVCLLVVGTSGYFLLVDQEAEPPAPVQQDMEVSAPTMEMEQPEETEVVEVLSPEPVALPTPMPEVEIDDTPVVAQVPRVIVEPLQGEVVTAFSVDELLYNATLEDWRTHDGVDIAAELGTAVLAASSGAVIAVENDAMLGTVVVLEHDGGYRTTYANLRPEPAVEAGDRVSAGQIIGAVGDTAAGDAAQGPHLHFSVVKDGEAVDPDEFLSR